MNGIPALGKLVEALSAKVRTKGFIVGPDVRRLVIRVEQARTSQHVASLTSQTEQLSDAVDGLRLAVDALPRRRGDLAPKRPQKVAKAQRKRPVAVLASPGKGLFSGL